VATDWAALIPSDVARDVISAAEESSIVMRLARTSTMPEGVSNVPVISVAPSAGFVAAGARKPLSTIEWSGETLAPEEIAALTYVPDQYLDDAGFPVWDSVRSEISAAIGRALDDAILHGVNAPASYPPGGIVAGLVPSTGTDALEAIDNALQVVEATGLEPDGIASSMLINAVLRTAYKQAGALPGVSPEKSLYGLPVATSAATAWPAGYDGIVGDWSKLIVGIREDLSFDISDSATLTDGAGNVVISAFESDVSVIRVYMRVACVLGKPVQADGSGTVTPFQPADYGTVLAAAAAEKGSAKK
jgi:hypothetical protein